MTTTAHVPLPDLILRDGTPVSTAFDDVYFSRDGGVDETEYVYLQGNGLPQRFTGCTRFTIGELGFGTGLNFLVAWNHWLETSTPDATLHYLSFEKYPLTPTMLAEALALQPTLKPLADQLLAAYPLRLPGLHRIHLPRVTLTLGFGDAAHLLPQIDTQVDAWFLDGFAPAKNPDMWNESLLRAIGQASSPQASFATFTAAGAVRRGLADHGFTVEKIPGYGHKREMLVGRRVTPASAPASIPSAPATILILGAGIAGATLAHACAERGSHVTVLERHGVASGASGNEAAVLFPQLSKRWKASAAWYFAAYSYMLQQLPRWRAAGLTVPYTQCGMLRLPRHAEEEAQLRSLTETLGLDLAIAHWVEAPNATSIAGVTLPTGAAYFPQGSWLAPQPLCQSLMQHPRIALHADCSAVALARAGNRWRITTADGSAHEAEHCILATAHDTALLTGEEGLKLHPVAGQVSLFATRHGSIPLRSILCRSGYVIPAGERLLVGATYNHGDLSCAVTDANHQRNQQEVAAYDWLNPTPIGGRTSIRATTPDRLPYVGQLDKGLWVSAGHGSRGMLSAPLAAEIIAAAIHGEAAPVTTDLLSAVHPHRFTHRSQKKIS